MEQERRYPVEIFETIFENTNEARWVIKNDQIIFCNKLGYLYFEGESSEDIIGNSIWDLSPEFQKEGVTSKSQGLKHLVKAARNEKPTFEWIHKNLNGKLFETEVSLSRFDFDESIFILATIRDLNDQRILEKELIEAKESAEKSAQLKTKFLANMSHDIRNPLNAILGFSKILADETELSNSERRKYATLIESNGNKLHNLINDIIDVSLIEANQMHIENKRCEVNGILEELYLSFQRKIETRENLRLKLNIAVDNPGFAIFSDPMRLRQVLSNLIENAIKYTQKGFVEFGYEITDDNMIQFFVRDSGIGIDSEYLENIFTRFSRESAGNTEGIKGTGLGLDISKRLVTLLGGKIWVFSTLNIGSEFYFNLPTVFLDYTPKPTLKTKKKTLSAHDVDWSDKHILIAEDDVINFELLRIILSKTKVKVSQAINGREALDILAKDTSIDLLLLDIQMPVMNGYEVIKELKSIRNDLPVIAQTAVSLENVEKGNYADLFDDCLSKPIDVKTLIQKIQVFFTKP
ncbi:MAG: response regulator [Bacteroidales bacterium]|nr:response regulator [Bacteroidales bacterium]